jgi:hypothetical protein
MTLAFVSAASGKKPDAVPGANGGGNTPAAHGNGNGTGGPKHQGAPLVAAPQPSTDVPAAAPAPAPPQHGNGNGHGGPKHNAAATPVPATPAAEPAKQSATAPTAAAAGAASAQPAATVPPPTVTTPTPATPAATTSSRKKATRGSATARLRLRSGRAGSRASQRARAGAKLPTGALAPTGPAAAPVAAGSAAAGHGARSHSAPARARESVQSSPIVRTLERVVKVIPTAIKAIILVLAILLALASMAWFLRARSARYLRRQRELLLEEVGVLQGALLPTVPAELSQLQASVAYTPAEGLAAGGDFYDAFALDDGRVGIVVGDVAGHGRDALMHTALLRYTLRAYLEADLEPRAALQVAGRSLDRGFDTLATVVLAVYDPNARVLRYASAGHPPPVFLGEADHVPVTVASSPPIGAGLPTGLRQTTVCLPARSAVCFFTDGLIEARRGDQLIGRLGLVDLIRGLGPTATATQVLERVAAAADRVDDDMAACMFRVIDGPEGPGSSSRVEELEVRLGEQLERTLGRFLSACGVHPQACSDVIDRARLTTERHRGAVVQVSLRAEGSLVQVRPANVESFASAEARRDATVLTAVSGGR